MTGFDHQHSQAQAGDDPVPGRKILGSRRREHGQFPHNGPTVLADDPLKKPLVFRGIQVPKPAP
ncbi:MAG TPA: hypothetical protein PKU91_10955, partial [Phycisphaerales bacterium]|nr:hypothetical protein [Phycisphaerales bacterium]